MLIEYLNAGNINKYRDYLDGDAAENIGRQFYRGMIAQTNGNPGAALIWEVINLYEDSKPTLSRIEWGKVTDDEMGEYLLEAYTDTVARDGVADSFFELDVDFDRTFIRLLKNTGFRITQAKYDMIKVKLSEAGTIGSAIDVKALKQVKCLEELSTRDFNRAIKSCVYNINRELVSDLMFLGINWYEQDISCYAETGGQCSGFLLVHRCTSGTLRIELLADWGSESQKNLLGMIRFSLYRALETYPDDTRVEVVLRDDATRGLVSYIFPQFAVSKCLRGDRTEA